MPQHSFTLISKRGRLSVLETECHACAAFDPHTTPEHQRPTLEKFTAIWDTGATGSVITQDVVDRCGLKPVTMTKVHGVGGVHLAEVFVVNIMLPNAVGFSNVSVTKGLLPGGAQMLIGMNIITTGDFCITNQGGNTVFSFRHPSQTTIDFVKEGPEQARP